MKTSSLRLIHFVLGCTQTRTSLDWK